MVSTLLSRKLLLLIAKTALGTSVSQALVIAEYDANRHLRFLNFSSTPSHNSQFIHTAYDLTGVGWHSTNTARQLTMISPLHFVGANHYKPGVGATINFLSDSGTIVSRTVASQTAITNDDGASSDLFIGTLSTPISDTDGVSFHPYLNLSSDRNYRAYRNQSLIVLGKTVRGASGTISAILDISSDSTASTKVLQLTYNEDSDDGDSCYFESGDSGSPVFIPYGGEAAIVGTNSLVSALTDGVAYSYSNFIPYYADKLNTMMEVNGYRMTKAIPGSTTLTLTHTPPTTIIRAGHSFSIQLNLANSGTTMAENVNLTNSLPTGAEVTSATGSLWFDESSTSTTGARLAQIDSGSSSDYSLTLTLSTPGTQTHLVTYSSDQSSSVTESFSLEVIESFISWSDGLTDSSATGDDDLDGISNLLEYAFGGDATVSSQLVDGESVSLLPEYSYDGTTHTLSYVRRKDYADRAISYDLTSSTDLADGSFSDASPLISDTNITSINDDLELVTYTLTKSGTERFFRIEVTLNE